MHTFIYIVSKVKDVGAKIFQSIVFFFNFDCSQIMTYVCQKCKKSEVTVFVSEIKRVENYPDFEMVHRGL